MLVAKNVQTVNLVRAFGVLRVFPLLIRHGAILNYCFAIIVERIGSKQRILQVAPTRAGREAHPYRR
jgi:hypothetical protein